MEIFAKHKILEIKTHITNGVQYIKFNCESVSNLNITVEQFYTESQINITEIEMLIGSEIKVSYYLKGELKKNEQVAKESMSDIKSIVINQIGSIDSMRVLNLDKLLYFNSIRSIKQKFTKEGKKLLLIELNNLKVIVLNNSLIQKMTALNDDELHLLIGEYVSPIFYKKGESSLFTNTIVRKDNTIVKHLNLRLNGSIDTLRKFK